MKRVITAIIIAAIFIPVLIFSHTVVFPIAISLLCGVAAYEILSIRGLHKKPYLSIPTILFVMICPIVAGTKWFSFLAMKSYDFLVVAFPAYMIYLFFVSVTFNRKLEFKDVSYLCMSISYLGICAFAMPFIRERANLDYLLLIICPMVTDIFALYTGKFFGKKKLCPAVSQHKTLEGFFGGILGGVVGALLYGAVRYIAIGGEFDVLFLVVAGIGISVVGQYGDLVASMMKRSSDVKDFGGIFPGHGGVMDRFDSVFAAFACAFVFLTAYNRIF